MARTIAVAGSGWTRGGGRRSGRGWLSACVAGRPVVLRDRRTHCRARWSASAARLQLHHLAVKAGVRRRFAPHQLRHAHAVELLHEGIPLPLIQRQLGHSHLSTTGTYLQGIDIEGDHLHRQCPACADDARQRRPCPVGPSVRERMTRSRTLAHCCSPDKQRPDPSAGSRSKQQRLVVAEEAFRTAALSVSRSEDLGSVAGGCRTPRAMTRAELPPPR